MLSIRRQTRIEAACHHVGQPCQLNFQCLGLGLVCKFRSTFLSEQSSLFRYGVVLLFGLCFFFCSRVRLRVRLLYNFEFIDVVNAVSVGAEEDRFSAGCPHWTDSIIGPIG